MPIRSEQRDDPRRDFLIRALASGLIAAGALLPGARDAKAQLFGRRPKKMLPGQSVYDVTGPVMVNGKLIRRDASISATDRIEAGKGAQVIFVVGADAFILRENSKLELGGSGVLVDTLRLFTGALLSVFGRGTKQVYGVTATIGIRGTGLYVESEPDLTYVCTCYGEVDIAASDDPSVSERIVSTHHDAPRYVLKPGASRRIQPAPFKNHTDLELMLIESLVGRTPPFSLFDESYGSPRRY
jgi:hypothetical protein